MIQRISDRLRKEDKGFTLIELMVVVLIIAILIAIAIPTFLGARKRAQDRAAQSSLRNTVTAGKVIFTDKEDYTAADVAALTAAEPSLKFVAAAGPSDDPTTVSVEPGGAAGTDKTVFVAAAFSKAGKCYYVQDVAGSTPGINAGTRWQKTDPSTALLCKASDAPAVDSVTWQRNLGDVG
jgi:type IV pilus assembly protein PilA